MKIKIEYLLEKVVWLTYVSADLREFISVDRMVNWIISNLNSFEGEYPDDEYRIVIEETE